MEKSNEASSNQKTPFSDKSLAGIVTIAILIIVMVVIINFTDQTFTGLEDGFSCGEEFIDPRDDTSYKTVQIGGQCWFAENLSLGEVGEDTLGGSLNYAETPSDLEGVISNEIPGYAALRNNPVHADSFGFLYNWHAVNQLDLCPDGWSVPSDHEWRVLEARVDREWDYDDFAESDENWDIEDYDTPFRGSFGVGDRLKAENYSEEWCESPHCGGSGFKALPGGARYLRGVFYGFNIYAYWWTSTEAEEGHAWRRHLTKRGSTIDRYYQQHGRLYSVRCLRDS